MWWRGWERRGDALLLPSPLLSSGTRQGRGRRKVEEMDKELRRGVLKVVALPAAAVRAWEGSYHWHSTTPCAFAIEWVFQKTWEWEDSVGAGTTGLL